MSSYHWRALPVEASGDTGSRAPGDDGLSGVWRREGRSLGGSRLAEPSLVVWVQAGRWFADVRVPRGLRHPARVRQLGELDRAQAFSGQLEREGDHVWFVHDLDTLSRPAPDQATVAWSGEHLQEVGDGYLERWRRVSHPSAAAAPGDLNVFERRSPLDAGQGGQLVARIVQVGDVAAAVWSSPSAGGALLQRVGGRARRPAATRWRRVAVAGDPTGGGDLGDALDELCRRPA